MRSTPPTLAVSYATASPASVAAFVSERYGLHDPLTCVLLQRGFNDIYAIRTAQGAGAVLRLSGHRGRGPADVAAETAFLAYLAAADVPVAAAIPAVDGAAFTPVAMPDGQRAAVLFPFIEGRTPGLDTPADAGLQGATLARLHDAADRYEHREDGCYRLDLDHLLHRPVASILALGLGSVTARADLVALGARLAAAVACADPALARTRCHGDCHGLNARIADGGRHAGQAVFFDFDDGGFGYLAYDLAVHLWAQVSFGRQRHAMWHAFQAGYEAVRPIAHADQAAIPLFVAIRHIWLMGGFADQTTRWGTEALSAAWLEREVGFLLAWERDRLGPALL